MPIELSPAAIIIVTEGSPVGVCHPHPYHEGPFKLKPNETLRWVSIKENEKWKSVFYEPSEPFEFKEKNQCQKKKKR